MKITYIIGPFRSPVYLIRCINAISRQTAEDNEIIVAENTFKKDEKLEKFLSNANVKLISDEPDSAFEKLSEAISLADDNSLINIISVDTVAVPIASETVSAPDADIIAVSYALRNKGYYTVKPMNGSACIDSREADIQNLFFRKNILSGLTAERFSERILFELWIDRMILDGVSLAASGEICLYCESLRINNNADAAALCLENKADILEIAEISLKANSKAGLFLFDKYLARLYKALISEQCDLSVKSEIFDIIKKLGELAKTDELAKRLFALYMGLDVDYLSAMDAEAYLFYADRMLTFLDKPLVKARVEQIAADTAAAIEKRLGAEQNAQLQRINKLESKIESVKSTLKSPRKLIKAFFALLKRKLRGKKN